MALSSYDDIPDRYFPARHWLGFAVMLVLMVLSAVTLLAIVRRLGTKGDRD